MPYIDPETIQRVKQLDLLTYLQSYEPHELVRICNGPVHDPRTRQLKTVQRKMVLVEPEYRRQERVRFSD